MTQVPAASSTTAGSDDRPLLFLSFELGQATWKLHFTIGLGQPPCERTITAGDLLTLHQEIAQAKRRFQLPPTARVISCYEAGRDAFWLHRYLHQEGIENLVVHTGQY
jgi:transposase